MIIDKLYNPIVKLGLGCVTFGREIDEEKSLQLMDYALSRGIVSFDTAAAYGGGRSEQVVGKWLKSRVIHPQDIELSTKAIPSYDPVALRLSVEASLYRLGFDVIDIFYLHRWDEMLCRPEPWLELENLRSEGKIRELGVSNFNAWQLQMAMQIQKEMGLAPIKYIQNNHNLAVSDLDDAMLALAKGGDLRIVTFSPLGAGFLTGKHQGEIQKGSRFDLMPAHQQIYFVPHAQARLRQLMSVASQSGYTAAHLALAWAMHQPDIHSVLVGCRSTAQIDQALDAVDFCSAELFSRLA